ncbi:hypothetical protein [Mycolicibacterium goodii]|uniref:Gp13 protein n=1 Tax=Mycolicibacterium goodii TaxID=134601 RepID=A0ABS6HPB9_MYCGD|nr:hypothetical protein [Mycolicibacterium goodii]YP_009013561.1 hypothetical protein DORI_11 [Mycobacterium phage Dori]UVT31544.1 major capsid pentamer protein [Mycobacterium phage Mask]AER47662.1 major capsid pentamer protein [Mycobacterium phage Dori]MBU8824126.1 hypothetical protein [Mycolicibacterium goodii]MBU8838091.1 hypothetical protein [Mycolicibacterium goodii]
MTSPGLAEQVFDPPLVNPAPNGLYTATTWEPTDGPPRWLAAGMQFNVHNYGGAEAFGVWGASWCVSADELTEDDFKTGERPELPNPYDPIVVWAFDYCDLTARSREEVRTRARQNLRIVEQAAVEREFAERMLLDGGAADTAVNLVDAVSQLEAVLAETNTLGFIHASPRLAAYAAAANLVVRSGTALKTPLGHTWVFGGGYVEGLGTTLVATSPTFGWRTEPIVHEAMKIEWNRFVAVAERSVLIGYEALLGAVSITESTGAGGFPGETNFPGSSNFPSGG